MSNDAEVEVKMESERESEELDILSEDGTVDEGLLYTVAQKKVNEYVRKLVQGQTGELNAETIILMVNDIMVFVGTLKIAKGSTKKRLVMGAIHTAIQSSDLSGEAKASLILTTQMVVPHVIDNLVSAAGKGKEVFGGAATKNKSGGCCNII